MKQSEFLFFLIKSLNPSEKRYFKRMAGVHGKTDANYIRLFDAIEKQEKFDEVKIKEQFKNEPFIKQFSVAKNYLYKLILKSIEAYNGGIDYEISGLINQAKVLCDKALFKQAEKILKKAKTLADKHERLHFIYEINQIYELVLIDGNDLELMKREFKSLFVEEKSINEKLNNSIFYRRAVKKVYFEHLRIGYVGYKEKVAEVEDLFEMPALQDPDNCLTVLARKNFFQAHFLYHYMRRDTVAAIEYSQKVIDITEANPEILGEDLISYIDMIYNHIIQCMDLNQIENCEKYIAKLRGLKTNDFLEKLKVFQYTYTIEFTLCTDLNRVEKGMTYYNAFINELPNYESKLSSIHKPAIFFLVSYNLLIHQKFEDALHWLNKALDMPHLNFRSDLTSWIRIQELIIQYELGNYRLLESKVRSTYRILLQKENRLKVEERLLSFFRKLASSDQFTSSLKDLFVDLKNDIEVILEDHAESNYTGFFNIQAWLESKISNRPFYEVLIDYNKRDNDVLAKKAVK